MFLLTKILKYHFLIIVTVTKILTHIPVGTGSLSTDPPEYLELWKLGEWTHNFNGEFARATIKGNNIIFTLINTEIMDNKHLKLDDLVLGYMKKEIRGNNPIIKYNKILHRRNPNIL